MLEETGIESSPRLLQVCPGCGGTIPVEAKFCPFDGQELLPEAGQNSETRRARKSHDSLVGWLIDERYEVLQLLGEGGMGCVYRVRHRVLGRLFALKALRPELARDSTLAERFVQEARAAAAISHPQVVSITDFGMLDEHQPYFVMELLEGRTLSSVLRDRGTIEPGQVALIARSVASALAAAHAVGVIHRDLKPDNVILLGDATVASALKVLDFGLAKLLGKSRLTRDDIVYGTPQYMSPEQAAGEPIDSRVDVYALGILMYEMLAGRVPFEADSYMGVLTKQLYAEPPPLACPVGLAAIVMRCLSKERTGRFSSMNEVIEALESLESVSPSVDSAKARVSLHSRSAFDSRIIKRHVWRRRWWVYALAGAVALGWALGLLFGRLDGGERNASPSVRNASYATASNPPGRAAPATSPIVAPSSVNPTSTVERANASTPASAAEPVAPNRATVAGGKGSASQPALRAAGRANPPKGAIPKTFGEKGATGSSEIANPWPE